jgi:hypothetical protein
MATYGCHLARKLMLSSACKAATLPPCCCALQVACQSDLRVIKRSKFWGQGDDLVTDLPSADGNLPATAAATAAQVMPLGELELVLDRRRRAQQRRQQAARQQGEQGQR